MQTLLSTLTFIRSNLAAAAGFRTYAMVVAAILFYAGGLLNVIPDAASQKLAGASIGLAIAFDRAAQKDHAASLQSTMKSVIAIVTGKPDPTPPTPAEYQQFANEMYSQLAKNLGIPVEATDFTSPPPLQVFQPSDQKAA